MKKFVCILLCAVMAVTVSAFTIGDVDGDGTLSNRDVVDLFSFVTGNTTPANSAAGDYNGDGSVDNRDVVDLFHAVSGQTKSVYAKQFTVSRVFGSGMVIQRNEPIRIWGWAPESENGKVVGAEFAGLRGAAVVSGGEWMITLDGTLKENTTGQSLYVYGEDTLKKFDDVLVGDVYWVAGQSNIAYSVLNIKNEPLANAAGRNVSTSDSLLIRLNRSCYYEGASTLTQGTNEVNRDAVQPRGWEYPSKGALQFSAVGYFTAYQLYTKLGGKVPIGMIEFDGNGLALHAFLPNEVRDALNVSTYSNGIYSAAGVNPHASSFMYNHYMYAFQNFPISGIIWYQGESDCQTTNNNCFLFADRFTAMINYFRAKHDQINHDYPVYIVEFPPIYMNFDYAQVRMNMGMIPTMLSNAHICTSADLWKDKTYENNLHPYNKWEISERMSDIMLANAYGVGDINYVEGPRAVSCVFSADGKTATIRFTNVGSGLKAYNNVLKGVKVITNTAWTSPSSATITSKDTIVVRTASKMLWVGYNTARSDSYPETMTLGNSAGVPSSAWQFSNMK
ncbi:MAG: hypothetical protein J6330_04060 [Clostridia bacterium]|nr:hypothetical protein [Clostridia bacterium]